MSTVIIIAVIVCLWFIGENPWILFIAVPGIIVACYFLFRETPEEKKDYKEIADSILCNLEKAKKFSDEHSWVIKKIDIMHTDSGALFAYMLVDDEWHQNIYHIRKLLEEIGYDSYWDAIEDTNGRIWLKRIVSFSNNMGYAKVLKNIINQKHPEWSVEMFRNSDLQLRILF